MSPVAFLLALAGLAGGTYLIRILGVKIGALSAHPVRAASAETESADMETASTDSSDAEHPGHRGHPHDPAVEDASALPAPAEISQSPARLWMDRATVVLIVAVAATTLLFEGHEVVGPARIIGSGAGILAALLKAPMLLCVVLAMAVCAGLRAIGLA